MSKFQLPKSAKGKFIMIIQKNKKNGILEKDKLVKEFKSQKKNDETCEILCEGGNLKGMFYSILQTLNEGCPDGTVANGVGSYRSCKVNKNSLSRSDFFAMMIRGKEDMQNDLTVDCTIFPLETVRIYVETIMGISKKPISLEILLDLIRFLLDFGKAERGRNYWSYFLPVLVFICPRPPLKCPRSMSSNKLIG